MGVSKWSRVVGTTMWPARRRCAVGNTALALWTVPITRRPVPSHLFADVPQNLAHGDRRRVRQKVLEQPLHNLRN
jgi:hypothetical protein